MAAAEPAQVVEAVCASPTLAIKDFASTLKGAARQNRRSYENRTRFVVTLPPAAVRCIVRHHRYAAGALISLELSLGCAQSISAGCCGPHLETRTISPSPSLSWVCCVGSFGRSCGFRGGCGSFRFCSQFLAD